MHLLQLPLSLIKKVINPQKHKESGKRFRQTSGGQKVNAGGLAERDIDKKCTESSPSASSGLGGIRDHKGQGQMLGGNSGTLNTGSPRVLLHPYMAKQLAFSSCPQAKDFISWRSWIREALTWGQRLSENGRKNESEDKEIQ